MTVDEKAFREMLGTCMDVLRDELMEAVRREVTGRVAKEMYDFIGSLTAQEIHDMAQRALRNRVSVIVEVKE